MWSHGKIRLIHETKSKGCRRQILNIAIAETIYGIWLARNTMAFSQVCIYPQLQDNIIYNIILRCTMHRAINPHVNIDNLCIK